MTDSVESDFILDLIAIGWFGIFSVIEAFCTGNFDAKWCGTATFAVQMMLLKNYKFHATESSIFMQKGYFYQTFLVLFLKSRV